MDFESPDVMKDFPGLYVQDINKRTMSNDDYSDEGEKLAKKDLLGKRKDKKEKKDKDRGYAALEGESSPDDTESKSPSKIKKTKAFKFSTKSKEKREKSREKEVNEKKKDKEKRDKHEKKTDKEKIKIEKKEKKIKSEESADLAECLPIFGVNLDLAVERSRCHDGVDIPLPVRAVIDYVQMVGLTMEGVYKIGGQKSKVLQLKKLYNQREDVDLTEYDVPTATSLLKLFLRDLPEPIFTSDLLIRYEEAGAILNVGTREKHLKILTDNLPDYNRQLLGRLLLHFDNVALNERHNKMNIHSVVTALSSSMHTSHKLLTALLHHCRSLFPTVILSMYVPPLTSSAKLPDSLEDMNDELKKQESLLAQIHSEMNAGIIVKKREELLWEVQRIITQLKRKIKNLQKDISCDKTVEEQAKSIDTNHPDNSIITSSKVIISANDTQHQHQHQHQHQQNFERDEPQPPPSSVQAVQAVQSAVQQVVEEVQVIDYKKLLEEAEMPYSDGAIQLLQYKISALLKLKEELHKNIENERNEIKVLKHQMHNSKDPPPVNLICDGNNLDEVMDLLHKENQILEIKKIGLVRQIMEQKELCINLKAKLNILSIHST